MNYAKLCIFFSLIHTIIFCEQEQSVQRLAQLYHLANLSPNSPFHHKLTTYLERKNYKILLEQRMESLLQKIEHAQRCHEYHEFSIGMYSRLLLGICIGIFAMTHNCYNSLSACNLDMLLCLYNTSVHNTLLKENPLGLERISDLPPLFQNKFTQEELEYLQELSLRLTVKNYSSCHDQLHQKVLARFNTLHKMRRLYSHDVHNSSYNPMFFRNAS